MGASLAVGLLLGCAAPRSTSARPEAATGIRGLVLARSTGLLVADGPPIVVMASPGRAPERDAPAVVVRCTAQGLLPDFAVVAPGREVSFANHDSLVHQFFSSSEGNTFRTGMLHPEGQDTVRLETPGTVHVYCALHGGKQGTILVAPSPHFCVLDATGQFAIEGVQPGRYTVELWRGGSIVARRELEVTRDGAWLEFTVGDPQVSAR